MKKYVLLIALLSLIALWPFFRRGFFTSHDGEWMIIRFSAFHQALAGGQFPVRFVGRLNNNYGYPVLNFLYPLPFYLAEIPKILGFGFVDSVKIIFMFSTLVSTLAMFWALSPIFSSDAALVGSIVYLYMPYRFVDLYVRGSLGENLAFAIAPIVLGCILKIGEDREIFLSLLALSVALLILSHNVIAILFTPIFLIIALLFAKSKIKVLLSFVAGGAIAAFFWVPAIYDIQFVRLSQIKVSQISDHLVSLKDLLIPQWGYGPNPQVTGGLSTQLGLVSVLVIIATLALLIKNREKSKLPWVLIIVAIFSAILMTKPALWFWQRIPYIDTIQFPWRLLSVVVLATSILAAQLIKFAKNNKLLAILIIASSFFTTITYTKPFSFVEKPDSYYATNEDTTTVRDEYLPIWVRVKAQSRSYQKIETQDANLSDVIIKPTKYKATANAPHDTQISVNTAYFPGWKAKIDDQNAPINFQNPQGLITFQLPKGAHKVIIQYKNSGIHLVSEIISAVALIATGSYFIYKWRKQDS